MRTCTHATLTGHWTGVFDYDNPLIGLAAAPFNALITDQGGALSGEIVEPNTFSPDPTPELYASLAGGRDGATVAFVKTYEPAERAGHQVIYEGEVNAELTKIEGRWRVGGFWSNSGPFVMNWAEIGEAAESEAADKAER